MADDKLRRRIVFEAARLMYRRQETEYARAKWKAAREVCSGWVKPSELPSNAEIRDEVQRFAQMFEGEQRHDDLRAMRLEALRVMRILSDFRPRLIGSTLTGHVRKGSDIDIHVFTSSVEAVVVSLEREGLVAEVEHKRVRKDGVERNFVHVHVQDRFPIELTLYRTDEAHVVFRSSITGGPIERASIVELEELLRTVEPGIELDEELLEAESRVDRFQVYRVLLLPLAGVGQSRTHHPEGDVLYHSLQVYDLAKDELPYDEEFLLAALLHDVGKGIDPQDHVAAALEALEGTITPRTAWLIEHHMEAHAVHDGSIGHRARKRLQAHEDFETLLLLGQCDREGRVPGVRVAEVDDVLEELRELARLCG